MSKAKQETIADIVAALRAVAYIQTAESPRDVLEFANRIEAAAKREREARAEAAQICGEIGEMIGREATREKSSRVGNSAKIRSALDKVVDFLRLTYAQDYPVSRDKLADAIDIGVSALAAPPRNCDRPECATPDAAQYTWNNEDGGKTAYYEWLLATYTEGGTTDGKKH